MTDARKTAIIDAASAILLTRAGAFTRFADRYPLVMSTAVFAEVTLPGYPGSTRLNTYFHERRFRVAPIAHGTDAQAAWAAGLHAGERATIALYFAQQGDFVVIDDGRGAGVCRRERIPYINALLVPRLLYYTGDASADWAEEKADIIRKRGHYGKEIVRFADAATAADFEPFLPGP